MSSSIPPSVSSRPPKFHIPSTPAPLPPRSTKEVGEAITLMDKRHGSAFESWIRDERNRGYLCTVKKELFEEYMRDQRVGPSGVGRAIGWFSEGWGVGSVAEVVLKLFYGPLPLDSLGFTTLCGKIVEGWVIERKADFVAILITGETAEVAAGFCWGIVKEGWEVGEIVGFVRRLAEGLKWSTSFTVDFLIEYVTFAVREISEQRRLIGQLVKDLGSTRWAPISENEVYWILFEVILEQERSENGSGKVLEVATPAERKRSDSFKADSDAGSKDECEGRIVRSDSGCYFGDEEADEDRAELPTS